jgi:hypothetical protein
MTLATFQAGGLKELSARARMLCSKQLFGLIPCCKAPEGRVLSLFATRYIGLCLLPCSVLSDS